MSTTEANPQPGDAIEPLQGTVKVTYDAGNHSITLSEDPIEPVNAAGETVQVHWILETVNANPSYDTRFGNIVLGDVSDQKYFKPGTFSSTKLSDKIWAWTYTPSDPKAPQAGVIYDIFVTYYKKADGDGRAVSLRQSLNLDPTLLTPPGG